MSTVRSPRPLSHWHFGFYNPHAIGAGRLAPLSHDSLVATSSSLINFSSRAFSRWVHMDLTWGPHLESFLLPAVPLPGRPPYPRRLRLGTCPRPGALGMSGLLQWGLLAVCASLVPMQAMACTIHRRPLDFGYLCITRENPEGYPRACPPWHTPRLPRIWKLTPCPESIISLFNLY